MSGICLRALAFVGALLIAPLAAAQTAGVPLQVRTGDQFTVNLDYTQSTEIAGQSVDAHTTIVYAIQVLNAEERLWRFMPVSLSYDMPSMPNLETEVPAVNWAAMSDAMSAFMRIATDVGFECRVDEYGRCADMTNWPFWSARVENLVLIADGIARMTPPPAPAPSADPKHPGEADSSPSWHTLREPVLRGVARMIDGYDSRDAASGMAGLYIPAFVQGRSLTRRQNVAVVDEYDMPWGAPPLRYTGTIRLERIDRGANTATVVRHVTLDQESARATLRSMTRFVTDNLVTPLTPYFPEGEQPPTAEAMIEMLDTALAGLSYEETTTGLVDLSTGMARETTTDFTVALMMGEGQSAQPFTSTGRIITRVTSGPPEPSRLPRN